MSRLLAAFALALQSSAAHTQLNTASEMPRSPPAADQAATKPDPVVATQAFMNRLHGEARAKSDAHAEGGYWLLLWTFLYGLAVAWLLLSRWISSRIHDFAERRTRRKKTCRHSSTCCSMCR